MTPAKKENEKYFIDLSTLEESNVNISPEFPFCSEESHRTYFADDFYPWHWHPTLQMIYVTRGQISYAVPGGTYTMSEGDGCFINAHTPHMLTYPGQGAASFVCLLFHPDFIGGDRQGDITRLYIRPITENADFDFYFLQGSLPPHQHILQCLKRCHDLYTEKDAYYELKIRSCLSDMWIRFDRLTGDYRSHLTTKASSGRLKAMITYINEHHMEDISLEDIAKAGLISRRECNRIFKQQLHTSPFSYLLQLRLKKACNLLSDTDLSVTEIGLRCGFGGTSYFIRLFKEKYGKTPKNFRKTQEEL